MSITTLTKNTVAPMLPIFAEEVVATAPLERPVVSTIQDGRELCKAYKPRQGAAPPAGS